MAEVERYSPAWMAAIAEALGDDAEWQRRNGRISADVYFEFGSSGYLLRLREGAVAEVQAGVRFTEAWDFALRARNRAWEDLLAAVPAPRQQSLFGFMKAGDLRLEGNVKRFMQHLWALIRLVEVMRSIPGAAVHG